MKINGNNPSVLPLDPAAGRSKPAAKSDEAKSVSVASVATQISSYESDLAGGVDAAKVEALKDAIREGRFKVNSEVVADKLIESAKELAKKP